MQHPGLPNITTTLSNFYGRYDSTGRFVDATMGATQVEGAPPELLEVIHPFWTKFPPANPMIMGLLAFVYTLLWVINAFGNFAVIYVFIRSKSLQTPANLLIVNLAFADFSMMLSQSPFFILNVFYSRWWYWGNLACDIYGFTGGLFGVAAIFTMVGIAFDRWMVITGGMKGPRFTFVKSVALIVFIWTYAIGINLPPLLGVWGGYSPEGLLNTCSFDYLTETMENKYFCLYIFLCAYCTPLSLLIFFYYRITGAVFSHEKTLREQAKKMNVDSLRQNTDQKEQTAEVRIAKASMTAVFLWVIIWTPYAAVTMTGAFGNRELLTPLIAQMPSIFCKTASCFNPIVFAISHPRFQSALREYFPWLYCIKSENSDIVSQGSATAKA